MWHCRFERGHRHVVGDGSFEAREEDGTTVVLIGLLRSFEPRDIEAKVIELDRNRNNVVLSRRSYLEEQQAEERQAFLDDLAVGYAANKTAHPVEVDLASLRKVAFDDLGGLA